MHVTREIVPNIFVGKMMPTSFSLKWNVRAREHKNVWTAFFVRPICVALSVMVRSAHIDSQWMHSLIKITVDAVDDVMSNFELRWNAMHVSLWKSARAFTFNRKLKNSHCSECSFGVSNNKFVCWPDRRRLLKRKPKRMQYAYSNVGYACGNVPYPLHYFYLA